MHQDSSEDVAIHRRGLGGSKWRLRVLSLLAFLLGFVIAPVLHVGWDALHAPHPPTAHAP